MDIESLNGMIRDAQFLNLDIESDAFPPPPSDGHTHSVTHVGPDATATAPFYAQSAPKHPSGLHRDAVFMMVDLCR
jgi:hypothetical protein